MAFTPSNFLTAERALDQITQDATSHLNRTDTAINSLVSASNDLAGMQNGWLSAVQFIDAQAAANPADGEWQALKSRKDKIVADFINMRDTVVAVRDAAQAAR